jgi:hypothetical protein
VVAAMSSTSSNDSNTYYTGSTGTRLNFFHDTYGRWVNPHSTFMIRKLTQNSAKINLNFSAFIISIYKEIGTLSNEIFDIEY